MAYLECAKGGGPGGLGDGSPRRVQGQSPGRGSRPPEADAFLLMNA